MRFLVFISIMAFLYGCESNTKPEKPDDLIAEEQMVDLLYDIQIINSAKSVNKRLLENQGLDPQAYIFRKYDIDSTRFARSNAYYAFDADQYEKILDRVQQRMDSLEKYYNDLSQKEEEKNKKIRDSLAKIREQNKDSLRKVRD